MFDLSSPRFQRRLAWTASFVGVVVLVVVAIALLPGAKREVETPLRPGPAVVPERPLHVTPAMRRQIDRLVQRFVATAVTRKDPEAAWLLVSSSMRSGVTRKQWNRGELPVFPYSAKALRKTSWKVTRAYDQTVELDVLLQPKAGSGERNLVYAAAVVRRGGRFVVDSFFPETTLGAAPAPQSKTSTGERSAQPAHRFAESKLDKRWLLVPVAILSLLLVVPLLLLVRGVVRTRRAERRYRRNPGT
jgi:hypothetical protein